MPSLQNSVFNEEKLVEALEDNSSNKGPRDGNL